MNHPSTYRHDLSAAPVGTGAAILALLASIQLSMFLNET